MSEIELKKAFAMELLRNPKEPFKAGLAIFGLDTGRALRAAAEWVNDEIVINEMLRLKNEGFEAFPKEELRTTLTTSLMRIVEDEKAFDDNKIKAARAIGELHGLIEKPQTTINVPVTVNKVMMVKDHGTNDSWEQRLKIQQKGLMQNAAATSH